MSITNKMLNKIDVDIENLKYGLQPENLEYWYRKITDETIEILPPWLTDKVNIRPVSYTHLTLPTKRIV